ncbi:unnamed protein product [Urochloa humidicola]
MLVFSSQVKHPWSPSPCESFYEIQVAWQDQQQGKFIFFSRGQMKSYIKFQLHCPKEYYSRNCRLADNSW